MPDWHPDENYSNGYAARNDLGGGVVLTLIHELDYLYWFFGKVNEVISITGKFSDLNVSTNDFSGILMKFKNDVVTLNIGGISNLTVIKDKDNFFAKDIGPGNCMIDKWIKQNSKISYDKNGDIARKGKVNKIILDQALDIYFRYLSI